MASAAAPAPVSRSLYREVVLVTLLAAAMLLPFLSRDNLIDPWETHYGEVGRRMLQDHDWVHTDWSNEGFRSKPVLTFWLMAASMKALGVAHNGGYSGEMVSTPTVMTAIRLPFALFGMLGMVLVWWMLANLINRRVAYLSLLIIGTTPFYLFVARQGITDMPMVATMMGAVAMFAMATETGGVAIKPFASIGRLKIDARHVLFAIAGGIVVAQAAYYAYYFTTSPQLAGRIRFPVPGIVIPAIMILLLAALNAAPWMKLEGAGRKESRSVWSKLFSLRPITTMRQVYMLWFFALLGVSVLAKGPPALGVCGVMAFFYIALLGKWKSLLDGDFEIKRGILLFIAIAIPWHLAMYLKEGLGFIKEYLETHLWQRATIGTDTETGTFNYYISQIGYGMHLWAALIPVALGSFLATVRPTSPEGRVKFFMGIWAITTTAFFFIVTTKFHHYILPALPALGVLIAIWIDDLLAKRTRFGLGMSLLTAGIILVITRDLMGEQKAWIDMFVFRYDRPWAAEAPYSIDAGMGFLGLGLASAGAFLLLGIKRIRVVGLIALAGAGIATGLWSMHAYMPVAAKHWGMREAAKTYYQEREIYGERLVYFGSHQLYEDWHNVKAGPNAWTFETYIPSRLQVGQPMTLRVQVNSPDDERTTNADVTLNGNISAIGDHSVSVALTQDQLDLLKDQIETGAHAMAARKKPVRVVDADRLIAWQLYWRGEVFWSGDEIWGWLPENKSAFIKTDDADFFKYLNDRTLNPLGRRYFIITEAGRLAGLQSRLPTQRAKDTFQILDTTSNKFSIGAFYL